MPQQGSRALLCLAVLLTIANGSVIDADPVRIVPEVDLHVELRPLIARGSQSGGLPARFLQFDKDSNSRARWLLQWPDPAHDSRLELTVSGQPGDAGHPHSITLAGTLTLSGSQIIRLRRTFRVPEGGSQIYELYREGELALTLTMKVRSELKGWTPEIVHAGEQVSLDVMIEGIIGERIAALESNRLRTFVGESVEYSFRRGQGETLEEVRLVLTPTKRADGSYEVEAVVDGSLPGSDGRSYFERRETLLLTKASTATLRVVRGDPPVGYRFRVSVSR